jgi:hypothetical protein
MKRRDKNSIKGASKYWFFSETERKRAVARHPEEGIAPMRYVDEG